jgi:hypothetical protein
MGLPKPFFAKGLYYVYVASPDYRQQPIFGVFPLNSAACTGLYRNALVVEAKAAGFQITGGRFRAP